MKVRIGKLAEVGDLVFAVSGDWYLLE